MSARADATPPEFEAFLFAEIGKEENGMTLTVASAFARLGLDPWQQAAVLARLSDVAAAASLASLIGRTELAARGEGSEGGAQAIASRLVALLPREVSGDLPRDPARDPPRDPVGAEARARPRAAGAAPLDGRGSRVLWLFWAAIAAAAAYMVWF